MQPALAPCAEQRSQQIKCWPYRLKRYVMEAARVLGLSRTTVYRRLGRHK